MLKKNKSDVLEKPKNVFTLTDNKNKSEQDGSYGVLLERSIKKLIPKEKRSCE